MKKVIIAYEIESNNCKSIGYWNYDEKTINYWNDDESDWAIVPNGLYYQIVEIVGIAKVKDNFSTKSKVISFLSNDNFPKTMVIDKNETSKCEMGVCV